jgi:hypothetical protein
MAIAGCIGLGLVWGWVAARLIHSARWTVVARVLVGLLVQGVLALRLATTGATIALGVAALVGAIVCHGWVRALERQYGAAR